MRKTKILVTGASGFVGRTAVRKLISQGWEVVALVRNKTRLYTSNVSTLVDQTRLKAVETEHPEKASVQALKEILEKENISTVVHIGAITGEHRISWDRYLEVNVSWTKNLAQALLKTKNENKKFVFVSTAGVYGTVPVYVSADEQTPCNPDGMYHKSKVLAERELFKLKKSSCLPLAILRPTTMYGNGDRGFLYKFLKLSQRKIFPLISSNPTIHLLDVETLAETFAQVVAKENLEFDVFNVADAETITLEDLSKFSRAFMGAGFLPVPSYAFSALKRLLAFDRQYSISLKLISESRFYSIDRLHKTFNLGHGKTIQALERKYLPWYLYGVERLPTQFEVDECQVHSQQVEFPQSQMLG